MRRTRIGLVLLFSIATAGLVGVHQEGTAAERKQDGMRMGGGMMGMGMMHGGMGRHHGMMNHHGAGERPLVTLMLRHDEALKLTPEQVQKLEALRSDFRKVAVRHGAELKVAEIELQALRRQDPVDLAKVEAQVKRIESLRVDARLARIKTIEKAKALLTPEQRKQLDTLGRREDDDHAARMMGCPMMGGMGW